MEIATYRNIYTYTNAPSINRFIFNTGSLKIDSATLAYHYQGGITLHLLYRVTEQTGDSQIDWHCRCFCVVAELAAL